jgi:hypothetical protein
MGMRVPQVTDRVKATPIQALRAVFAGIGQLLLVADRPRNQAPAAAREQAGPKGPAGPKAPGRGQRSRKSRAGTEPTRWRSLDQTGNVRLLSAEEMAEINAERAAAAAMKSAAIKSAGAAPTGTAPAAAAPAAAAPAAAAPAPATTPTSELAPAAPGATTPTITMPTPATAPAITTRAPDADQAADEPAVSPAADSPADLAQTDRPATARVDSASLPVPNYDELAIASLRARLRNLDAAQLRVLVDYEQANAARPEILTMFARRIAKLGGA